MRFAQLFAGNTHTEKFDAYHICVYYFLLICTISAFSCEGNVHNTRYPSIKIVDSISLPALVYTPKSTLCAKYFDDGNEEFLFWGNRPNDFIEIFNLSSRQHVNTIQVPIEGPSSIPNLLGGFTVLNMDTIIVSTDHIGRLYIIDTSSAGYYDIINHTDTSYKSLNNLVSLNSNLSSDIYLSNNSLIIPFRIPNFRTKPTRDDIREIQLFKVYDLTNRSIRILPMTINPHIYDNPNFRISGSNCFLNGRLYFQYATDHNIYYSDDLIETEQKMLQSRFSSAFVPFGKYPRQEYILREFIYKGLIADVYNNRIIRIVKLPVNDVEIADEGKESDGVYERVSMMVLDEDLNLLGEILFEHSNYSWDECFIGRNGIYILRSPYHPHYSEAEITYDIYELQTLQKDELQ